MSRKVGRNDPCHCGSGKKYKKCHMREDQERARALPPGVSAESLEGSVPLPAPGGDLLEAKLPAEKLQEVEQAASQLAEVGNSEKRKELEEQMKAIQALMRMQHDNNEKE